MIRFALPFVVTVTAACAFAPGNEREGVVGPDLGQYESSGVGDYIEHRCGSLDCHGQATRNMVIYGCDGLRLDPDGSQGLLSGCDTTDSNPSTTTGEYEASYRSIVGLEPNVMTAVVTSGGAHPELLTFIRKARGWDAHKGGALIVPGDDQDVCLTSWLAGSADATACGNAELENP